MYKSFIIWCCPEAEKEMNNFKYRKKLVKQVEMAMGQKKSQSVTTKKTT